MCWLFLVGNDTECSFAHRFLTLVWNLILQSETWLIVMLKKTFGMTTNLGLCFLSQKLIKLVRTLIKSDKARYPCSCPVFFSNTHIFIPVPIHDEYDPRCETRIIDPILSSSNISKIWNGFKKLFLSCNQYNRFIKCFGKVILENWDELERFWIHDSDLGFHSARKESLHCQAWLFLLLLCMFVWDLPKDKICITIWQETNT